MDNSLNNQGIPFHQPNQPNQKSKADNKAPEDRVKDYINAMGEKKLISASEGLLKEMNSLLDDLSKLPKDKDHFDKYRHKIEKGLKVDNSFYHLSVLRSDMQINLIPPSKEMGRDQFSGYLSTMISVLHNYCENKQKDDDNATESAGEKSLQHEEIRFTDSQKKDIEKKIEESVINIEFAYDDDKNPQRKLHLKHVGPQCEDMRDFLKTSTDPERSRAILQQQEQERRHELSAINSDTNQTSVLRAYDSDSPSQEAAGVGEKAETIRNEPVEKVVSTDESGKKKTAMGLIRQFFNWLKSSSSKEDKLRARLGNIIEKILDEKEVTKKEIKFLKKPDTEKKCLNYLEIFFIKENISKEMCAEVRNELTQMIKNCTEPVKITKKDYGNESEFQNTALSHIELIMGPSIKMRGVKENAIIVSVPRTLKLNGMSKGWTDAIRQLSGQDLGARGRGMKDANKMDDRNELVRQKRANKGLSEHLQSTDVVAIPASGFLEKQGVNYIIETAELDKALHTKRDTSSDEHIKEIHKTHLNSLEMALNIKDKAVANDEWKEDVPFTVAFHIPNQIQSGLKKSAYTEILAAALDDFEKEHPGHNLEYKFYVASDSEKIRESVQNTLEKYFSSESKKQKSS